VEIDVPEGIIAHLTRECGGNVHDCNVVIVTGGSFEREPYSPELSGGGRTRKNIVAMEDDNLFQMSFRDSRWEHIPHTKNSWICYDFKERRVVPTHYAIRTNNSGPGAHHLKSWLVETSVDGEAWHEVDHKEDNKELNGRYFIGTYAVAGAGACRFIRLVNIGRTHSRCDLVMLTGWEIFGSLFE
jgi:hypothetical protein